MSKKKRDHSPDAVEARRAWAREQLLANPYMHTYGGPNNLLDLMHKKFGVAIDTTVLGQIKKEVLAEKGLTSEQVMAHQRSQQPEAAPKKRQRVPAKKPLATPSRPMAYFGKQLALVTKTLRKALPDVTRFAVTLDGDTTNIEYTVRQLSEVSGKVKLP